MRKFSCAVLVAVVAGTTPAEGSDVPAALGKIIREAAAANGLDERMLVAVARRESRFRADAVSRAGALGVMQLMPATAKALGVRNPFDPRENIFAAARYLKSLHKMFDGNVDLVLAAYNAGPTTVRRHGRVPAYPETEAYVRAIRAEIDAATSRR